MSEKQLPQQLPKSLHRFFWDIDVTKLNPAEKPLYVINRLLYKGNFEAARWTLQSFPKKTIVKTLSTIRGFSPWSGRFWAYYFGIPESEVACLKPSYLKTR